MSLEIYDTAGQEEFSTMQDEYYRSGDGFLLVYNITSQLSYNDLQDTYNKLITAREAVDENAPPPPIVLAGNKCDLQDKREVTNTDGKKLGILILYILYISHPQNRRLSTTNKQICTIYKQQNNYHAHFMKHQQRIKLIM